MKYEPLYRENERHCRIIKVNLLFVDLEEGETDLVIDVADEQSSGLQEMFFSSCEREY